MSQQALIADGHSLAGRLERVLPAGGIVLHDRVVPETQRTLDHLAVTSSGIWVIEVKRWNGALERRVDDGPTNNGLRLYVNGRDRSHVIGQMHWQADSVRRHVEPMSIGCPPIHTVLCFVNAEFPETANAFSFDGVWLISPDALADLLAKTGDLSPEVVDTLASEIRAVYHAAA